MSLTAADGTGLTLRSLTAKVVIEPPLSFTQLELSFENPEPRRREGRFEIALPPGAAISRLALQMGDTYQEGEVVERKRAHVAYEEALHGRRDPALLERDAGNQYRVRVFPIEARETKHLIVAYSERIEGGAPQRLHLQGLPAVERVRVQVARPGQQAAGLPGSERFARDRWTPDGDLLIPMLASPEDGAIRSGELALVHVTPFVSSEPASLTRLTVLLDTSASSASQMSFQVERLRALTGAIAARRGSPIPLQLVVFDQEAVPLLETTSDRLGEQLEALLRARGQVGATDLAGALLVLSELPELGDRVWLFSDGIATAGETGLHSLQQRVEALATRGVRRFDVVSPPGVLDETTLAALVRAGLPETGVVVTDDDPATAAERLMSRTSKAVDVEVVGATWTYPSRIIGAEAGRHYPVFALVSDLPEGAPLRVRIDGQLRPLPIRTAALPALLEREWARAKLDYLARKLEGTEGPDRERVRAKIVELSQSHRVLCDHTALVVLETEADYRRHGIARTALSDILVVEGGQLLAAGERQVVEDTLFHEPFLRDPRTAAAASGAAPANGGAGRLASAAEPSQARPQDDERALNSDTLSVLGALMGDAIWEGFGADGLGLRGTSRGGGGTGEGTIGLGNIGTIGHGAEPGFGRGAGGFRGRDSAVPVVRTGKADVRGSLSKEVIRRIIRRHINEVRFCYEQRLFAKPALSGGVSVKFIIAEEGSVRTASVVSTTLDDPIAERCVATAVRRWTFPAPAGGGIVAVTYPFHFQPGSRIALASPATRPTPTGPTPTRAQEARAEARRTARLREYLSRPRPTPADHLEGPLLRLTERIARGEPALADALSWQRRSPQDPFALIGLARAAQAVGHNSLAARAYGSLIDLYPSRADMRRAAGQRLEALGELGLSLAIDSYEKAVALRPDHPSGHRLLGFSLLRAGRRADALAALREGQQQSYPRDRFPGIERLFDSDMALIEGRDGHGGPATRMCLYWETDATDMNLHVYDGRRRHIYRARPFDTGAGQLEADLRRGYGPECFTAVNAQLAYPFRVQADYPARGPMGHSLAALHILQRDRDGELHTELRPFAIMRDRARVDLGQVPAPAPELARAR